MRSVAQSRRLCLCIGDAFWTVGRPQSTIVRYLSGRIAAAIWFTVELESKIQALHAGAYRSGHQHRRGRGRPDDQAIHLRIC